VYSMLKKAKLSHAIERTNTLVLSGKFGANSKLMGSHVRWYEINSNDNIFSNR
jgi:hypothetical protein